MTTSTTIHGTAKRTATTGTAVRFVKATEGERVRVLDTDVVVKASAVDTEGRYEVVVGSSPEGAEIAPSRHPWEELYFILDGAMEIRIGGEQRLATAGDFVVVPAHAEHSFTVVTEFVRFLDISMGPGTASAAAASAATSAGCRPLL